MNKETIELLKNRHTYKLQWCEPWPGKTADGNEIDCHIELIATVHDCINMERRTALLSGKGSGLPDYILIDSFIATHWAQVLKPVSQLKRFIK